MNNFEYLLNKFEVKPKLATTRQDAVGNNTVDFTDSIIRDILIAGIEDSDIRPEIFGVSCGIKDYEFGPNFTIFCSALISLLKI